MVKMVRLQPHSVVYAAAVQRQLRIIPSKYHSLIHATVEEQLSFEPEVESTNRKPLVRPPLEFDASWELRFGPDNRFRVFYDVDVAAREVHVVAIGVKLRNRLRVGTEEVQL
jgi:mRNA-degrading endonuclease RelE of RelBE toxin-antitoxin system